MVPSDTSKRFWYAEIDLLKSAFGVTTKRLLQGSSLVSLLKLVHLAAEKPKLILQCLSLLRLSLNTHNLVS